MRGRTLWIVLLALLLLTGCQKEKVKINEAEPTAVYDWMAGESPVPNLRMGIVRKGLNAVSFGVSPSGIYFIPVEIIDRGTYQELSEATYIMYIDYGSNTVNKLCGRADCTHDNADCNAYLYRGSKLTYYQEHLYAVTGNGAHTEECKLVRIEPDGSNHVEVFDLLTFAEKQGASFAQCSIMTDGYCVFGIYGWKEQEDGTLTDNWMSSYKYKLDGSMKEPEPLDSGESYIYHSGELLLGIGGDMKERTISSFDIETGNETFLTKLPKNPILYTEQEFYRLEDGAVIRQSYATGEDEVMENIGLGDEYVLFAFPDCLVAASREDGEDADPNLYFYNWAFELVDTVELDYPRTCSAQFAVMAETADRVYLTDHWREGAFPLYYIDKSELGSGNVQVHRFILPEQ